MLLCCVTTIWIVSRRPAEGPTRPRRKPIMRTQQRHVADGFTVVEILIAVLVVGLLTAIAALSYGKIRAQIRIKQAEGEIQFLATAISQYAWDTGEWPRQPGLTLVRAERLRNKSQNDEVWNLTEDGVGLLSSNAAPNWNGPYIREIHDDPWGNPYFFDPDYRRDGRTFVVVASFGPTKQSKNSYDDDDIIVELRTD